MRLELFSSNLIAINGTSFQLQALLRLRCLLTWLVSAAPLIFVFDEHLPCFFLACALIVVAPAAVWAESEEQERGPYVRLGAGVKWPENSVLEDQSCSSSTPFALLSCGHN